MQPVVVDQVLPLPSFRQPLARPPRDATAEVTEEVTEEVAKRIVDPSDSKPTTMRSEPRSKFRNADAFLASTRTNRLDRRYPATRAFDARRPMVETVSPYNLTRVQSARQSADRFRMFAETSMPIIEPIALQNANFADQWAELAETHQSLSARLNDATTKLETTTRDFDDVATKLEHYGLTPTIGQLLRNKKEQLAQWQINDSLTLFTREELDRTRQMQLDLEMIPFDGSDPVEQANEILANAEIKTDDRGFTTYQSQLQNLLYQRHEWLTSLRKGYEDYQQQLGQLDSTTTASAALISDYRNLINRHITWIRSGDPVGIRDVWNLDDSVNAFFDSRTNGDFGYTLQRKWVSNPIGAIGLFVLGLLILLVRWRSKSWLIGIGTRKRLTDATDDTRVVAAGLLTILVSIAFPCVLYMIARWLGSGVVSESTLHSSTGFYAASLVALMVEIPRHLLRTSGYIDKHVDVDLPGRGRASAYLTLIGFGLVLAAYVITITSYVDHGMWRGSLPRFGFMAAMLLVAWTFHLSLKPSGGFLEPLIAKFGGSVIHRIRLLIYLAAIGFPLAMLVLSALGYEFTVNVLVKRAMITLTSALIAATLWPTVKILSARAWQTLTGATPPPRKFDEYGEIKTDADHVTGVLAEHSLELKHQLAFLCQCGLVVGALLSFGWLWIDIAPSVQMGNPVVWNVDDTITQTSVDAAGETITSSVVETTPVTVLHLMLAAATLFVSFQLAKLVPAIWDALVLQRVSFDEGMEHLTLILGRCLLFGIGCLIACKLIGVRWQTIQWLAVGLTIGLGFGLQDMVRNLFGGIIVLFEKPARLGDLISVGKANGRVAAQRLRTTVLTDDDGREVIIPNKNFVSEPVVNWMGSGRLTVIPLEVAVTRDERPADICRSLQELILGQPDVLLTPAPQATLVCVAKDWQRIELRAWVEQGQQTDHFRDNLLRVVRKHLKESNHLASSQPDQPSMRETNQEPSRRRRSA